MNQEIEKLIEIAARGNVVTDRQKDLIRNKAISLNEDPDEVELLLEIKHKEFCQAKETNDSLISPQKHDEGAIVDEVSSKPINTGYSAGNKLANFFISFNNCVTSNPISKQYGEPRKGDSICGIVGDRTNINTYSKRKNKTVAALLALFVGGLGIHKFYMGQIASGILYLLFFWTFIPTILGLINGIVLLCETDEQFYSQINENS